MGIGGRVFLGKDHFLFRCGTKGRVLERKYFEEENELREKERVTEVCSGLHTEPTLPAESSEHISQSLSVTQASFKRFMA